MREDTVVTKVYPFVELSDGAKQTAVENLRTYVLDYDWWEYVYEDAATIGLVIEEFDICACVRGHWDCDAEDCAQLIQEHHGEACETHKDATAFLADIDGLDTDGKEYAGILEDKATEFLQVLCKDYSIIIQKEYEYLTSDEAIIETIETNGYEFTSDGRLY